MRDAVKFHRLVEFCRALPRIRRTVEHDLHCKCLCKRKVVATIVSLMESAQLRVGNEEYARTNGSYGATTLRNHHVKIRGPLLELSYRGKSGIERRIQLRDKKLATTWAATMAAALLLCALDHPDSERACKRCVNETLARVANQLGHTPAICRKSYIHPQVIEDFMSNRLEKTLVRNLRRQVRQVNEHDSVIDVALLRAVEPAVARYLDSRRRLHA